MQTNTSVWVPRAIGWLAAIVLSCGVILGSTFMLGPTLFSGSAVGRKVAVMLYCPGAESSSVEEGASTPTTTSPSGTRGHTMEITCTFADGSQKVITNEQAAVAAIGGMFGLGALCGVGVSIPILLAPLFLFRRKQPAT